MVLSADRKLRGVTMPLNACRLVQKTERQLQYE